MYLETASSLGGHNYKGPVPNKLNCQCGFGASPIPFWQFDERALYHSPLCAPSNGQEISVGQAQSIASSFISRSVLFSFFVSFHNLSSDYSHL